MKYYFVPPRMALIKSQKPVLVRMWTNRNCHSSLVGVK